MYFCLLKDQPPSFYEFRSTNQNEPFPLPKGS